MLLADSINLFLTFKKAKGLSPKTIAWYSHVLNHFDIWLGARKLNEIIPLTVALYIAHERERKTRKGRPLAPRSIEATYRGLSAFFNWCETASSVGKHPSPLGHGRNKEIERPIVDDPDLDYVTFEEYTTLVAAIDFASWLDYRDWCLISLMFWCGLRSGELLAIEGTDLRLAKNEVRVKHTKSRKTRPAFLLEDITAGLRTYLETRPPWPGPELWLAFNKSRTGIAGALSKTGLRLMLQRRCRRANIRFLNPHLFRHGFAMEFLNHDAELKAVSVMLGHTTVKTTEKHYAQWLDGPLRRVHQRIAERISSNS